jgi:hypothetical protein
MLTDNVSMKETSLMRHLGKWAFALLLVLSSPQVFATEYADNQFSTEISRRENAYICNSNGPGSAKVVVVLDREVVNALVKSLTKNKDATPKITGSNDLYTWIEGKEHVGTALDGHTGCYRAPNNITNYDVDCRATTYECAVNRELGDKYNAGKYHGIIQLHLSDIKDSRTPAEKMFDWASSKRFADEFRKALVKVPQERGKIQSSFPSKDASDQWKNPSQCLSNSQDSTREASINTTFVAERTNLDRIAEECGENDGRALKNKRRFQTSTATATGATVNDGGPTESLDDLKRPPSGTCPGLAAGMKDDQKACELIRSCGGQVFPRTCISSCSLNGCFSDYKKYLAAAGLIQTNNAETSHTISLPNFNMSERTKTALLYLQKYGDSHMVMDCELYQAAYNADPKDINSKKALDSGCSGDMSLRFLKKVLLAFQDSNSVTNFSAQAQAPYHEFTTLRTFIETWADNLDDLDAKQFFKKEIAGKDGFLDFVQRSNGGANYFGKSSVRTSTGNAPSGNPKDVFPFLDSQGIKTDCLLRVRDPMDVTMQNFYVQNLRRDYGVEDHILDFADGSCSSGAATAHPASGR